MTNTRTPDAGSYTLNSSEDLLQRWSRRKTAARIQAEESVEIETVPADIPAGIELPPLESLQEHSDVSGFLSPEVSRDLRRLALKKLFHLPKFNITDGLDDYDEDYRNFAALGDIITADMRHHLQRAAEEAKQALLDDEPAIQPAQITEKEPQPEHPGVSSERVSSRQPGRNKLPETPDEPV